MSARAAEEVAQRQRDLERSLTTEGPRERVVDILKSLEEIQFTSALIVSSKIANTVNATKKRFPEDATVRGLCKRLIQSWKSVYKSETAGAPVGSSASGSAPSTASPRDPSSSTMSPPTLQRGDSTRSDVDDADDCEKMTAEYPEGRRKIISAISDSLSLDMDGKKISNPVAYPLACGIEMEINAMFPFHKDLKGYQTKTRKIFFSLKSNAELRQDLLEARLSVTGLLQLPNEQLATRAKREQAQKERDEMMLAKRDDYYTITRDQMMLENGLDPEAGGEHTCSKCKGQKTSSYSLQTRSADEPMTVFVTCLTCGKRWRC